MNEKRRKYLAVYRNDPKNIARAQEKRKARYAANPEKYVAMQRKYYYGIEAADADALMMKQGGCCAVCSSFVPGGRGRWHLDHDHVTGKVRGFLCHKCNNGLGFFLDNPALMRQAALYVEAHV